MPDNSVHSPLKCLDMSTSTVGMRLSPNQWAMSLLIVGINISITLYEHSP